MKLTGISRGVGGGGDSNKKTPFMGEIFSGMTVQA